jgi:hypothetical protein
MTTPDAEPQLPAEQKSLPLAAIPYYGFNELHEPFPQLDSGGRLLGKILHELAEAPSTGAARYIINQYSFYTHRRHNLLQTPQVTLQNYYLYTLPFQECREHECTKRGFSVRNWGKWWKLQGWHPPMSVESRPPSVLMFSPVEAECFGPPF